MGRWCLWKSGGVCSPVSLGGVEQGTTQPPKLKGPGGWVGLVRALGGVGKWVPVRGRGARGCPRVWVALGVGGHGGERPQVRVFMDLGVGEGGCPWVWFPTRLSVPRCGWAGVWVSVSLGAPGFGFLQGQASLEAGAHGVSIPRDGFPCFFHGFVHPRAGASPEMGPRGFGFPSRVSIPRDGWVPVGSGVSEGGSPRLWVPASTGIPRDVFP